MDKKRLPSPFGPVLVKARQQRGVTQYQLAKLTGRNTRQIAQLEHGKCEPRLSTIIMLAEALQMDAGELVSQTVAAIKSHLT